MNGFHTRPVEELENILRLFGKDWALITAGDPETVNTMTASWGGAGVLWNRPVAFCFIRPQRHTFTLTEANDRLSLSFLPEQYRESMRICGRLSGRDTDKAAETGLRPLTLESGAVAFEQARLILDCRRLYADVFKKENFLDPTIFAHYPEDDFHHVYICEIEKVLERCE